MGIPQNSLKFARRHFAKQIHGSILGWGCVVGHLRDIPGVYMPYTSPPRVRCFIVVYILLLCCSSVRRFVVFRFVVALRLRPLCRRAAPGHLGRALLCEGVVHRPGHAYGTQLRDARRAGVGVVGPFIRLGFSFDPGSASVSAFGSGPLFDIVSFSVSASDLFDSCPVIGPFWGCGFPVDRLLRFGRCSESIRSLWIGFVCFPSLPL